MTARRQDLQQAGGRGGVRQGSLGELMPELGLEAQRSPASEGGVALERENPASRKQAPVVQCCWNKA